MAEYGLESRVADLNFAGAQIARRAVDRLCRVAGGGAVSWPARWARRRKSASVSHDVSNPAARPVTFDQLRENYRTQAKALVEGGVDLLLLETVFDTLNAKAALFAIEEYFESVGRARSGDRLGDDRGSQRAHALRANGGGFLDFAFRTCRSSAWE